MSNRVTGKVEVVAPNKVGFYNFKVGADWYGIGSKNRPTDFDRGSEISFDVEVTEKGFKNAKNISVVPAKTGTEGPRPTKAQGTPTGVDWDLKDRKIQQQSARNAAIEFLGVLASQDAIVYKATAKPTDKVVVLEAMLEHYTEKFLSATAEVGQAQVTDSQTADSLAGEES